MKIGVLPDLTKKYILQYISEIEIMAYYLPLPISEIEKCLNTNHLVCSPLRNDEHPTCSVYIAKDGRPRFRDLAGYFWGDCYDVVGYRFFHNPKSSQGFAKILDQIAKDFLLHKYADEGTVLNKPQAAKRIPKYTEKTRPIITTQRRKFDHIDLQFWGKSKLFKKHLDSLWIYPVLNAWINGFHIYNFNYDDPCYEILIGKDETGFIHRKLYFPSRRRGESGKPRFMTNTNRMMGMHLVKKAEFGIITKAIKDVGAIKLKNVQSVSLAGEGILPMKSELNFLFSYWQRIYSLLDFDLTGIRTANKLRKLYNIQPLFLTNGRFNTIDFNAKDPSEFIEVNGWNNYSTIVDTLLDESYGWINTNDYYDFISYYF
jgi:hypothetical protein